MVIFSIKTITRTVMVALQTNPSYNLSKLLLRESSYRVILLFANIIVSTSSMAIATWPIVLRSLAMYSYVYVQCLFICTESD